MTTREPRLPYGCIVGKLARDIGPAIHDCAMSQKAKTLMACITADALGNAGWEPEHKEEAGLWCDMDTAAWAAKVKCSKQYISRLVDQLADLGLVTRHEAPKSSFASCRLRFNPDLDHWLPRQANAHTERYSKTGAGRPRKKGSERNTPDYQEASVTHQISNSHNNLQARSAAQASTPALSGEDVLPFAIRNKSDVLRSVGEENYSDVVRQPAQKIISLVTPARHEGAAGHAPEAAEERITEEETYRDTKYLAAVAASQPPLLESERQEDAKASKGKDKEDWPARADDEAELAYYQRVIKEAGPARYIPLLVRLAHEKVCVPLESESYSRMTQLAKRHTASLMVKYILRAAGEHIDGKPMNYLTKIANSAERRQEGTNGHTGRRQTYQSQGTAGKADQAPSTNDADWSGWDHVKVVLKPGEQPEW